MKKIILCLLVLTFGIACNNYGTISEAKLKKALDIAYQELSEMSDLRLRSSWDFEMVKSYLADKNYLKGIQCTILEKSDVDGTIYNRACLLKNVNKQEEGSSRSPDVLVIGFGISENTNIIGLLFLRDAKRIETGGYSYSTWLSFQIKVNLETHKIGEWK